MIINRAWAMPSRETFSIKPIRELIERYNNGVSLDPFARNSTLANITNDLNPKTEAQYHMKALEFLELMKAEGRKVDTVIFDPPYTLRQVKECYEGVGQEFTHWDSKMAIRWGAEREILNNIVNEDGAIISFGYTTTCMGKKRGWEIVEILIVSHGPAHNDTLCTVEQRAERVPTLFEEPTP